MFEKCQPRRREFSFLFRVDDCGFAPILLADNSAARVPGPISVGNATHVRHLCGQLVVPGWLCSSDTRLTLDSSLAMPVESGVHGGRF